jgi:hypothetical protein
VGRAMTPRVRHAQAAREQIERALDFTGWPWARRLSLWLDAFVILEETAP